MSARASRSARPSAGRALLLVLLFLAGSGALSACRSSGRTLPAADPGPYDRLGSEARHAAEALLRGLEAEDERDARVLAEARAALAELGAEHPLHLPLAIAVQELELELLFLGEGLAARGLPPPAADATAEERAEALRRVYHQRSLEAPSPVSLVLAARLESDDLAALAQLDEALALDAECNWAHYGRAFVLHRLRRFDESREALEAALALDPGHLPTRRFEAALLARGGNLKLAQNALFAWVDAARKSPFVDRQSLGRAELDLATLQVWLGDYGAARSLLAGVAPDRHADLARALEIESAALAGAGRPEEALRSADAAQRVDPTDPLGAVQASLLHELWGQDPVRAHASWRRVVELAYERFAGEEGGGAPRPENVQALLQWIQAQAHLERLEALDPALREARLAEEGESR